LHIYSGELGSKKTPWVLGHEAIGIVTAVGSAVDVFKVGDKVVVPDTPSSGELEVEDSSTLFGNLTGGIYGFGEDFGPGLGGCQGKELLWQLE
jgi:threonine dehydrogenase-like Zn-dependent dehydrogenase